LQEGKDLSGHWVHVCLIDSIVHTAKATAAVIKN
jgi:hypothetical protein